MTQKTVVPGEDEIERQWVIFDASDIPLGRLASRVAKVLRGKHKRTFTPHLDGGDGVIVINASDVEVTGNKSEEEYLRHHSGYPGGLKEDRYDDVLEKDASKVVYWAIRGMLPKNRLGRSIRQHLRIYNGPEHQHEAQQPVEYDWENEQVPNN